MNIYDPKDFTASTPDVKGAWTMAFLVNLGLVLASVACLA